MPFQTVFKRYELKYLLTGAQKQAVIEVMALYMKLDQYGRTTIRNIYLDTDNYRLVRHSIESPVYKEKLRIRSYNLATEESTVFVELKKKFDSVVYKRRLPLPEEVALEWIAGYLPCPVHSQIADEIEYFRKYYETLHPTAFLSYEREAYYATDGSDFRVTFDEDICAREDGLSLCDEAGGTLLLPEGLTLMEIKCSGGIPLWMTHTLTQHKIYKASFSKYGTAYEKLIYPHLQPARSVQQAVYIPIPQEVFCYA